LLKFPLLFADAGQLLLDVSLVIVIEFVLLLEVILKLLHLLLQFPLLGQSSLDFLLPLPLECHDVTLLEGQPALQLKLLLLGIFAEFVMLLGQLIEVLLLLLESLLDVLEVGEEFSDHLLLLVELLDQLLSAFSTGRLVDLVETLYLLVEVGDVLSVFALRFSEGLDFLGGLIVELLDLLLSLF
jgi:hypothetical protein